MPENKSIWDLIRHGLELHHNAQVVRADIKPIKAEPQTQIFVGELWDIPTHHFDDYPGKHFMEIVKSWHHLGPLPPLDFKGEIELLILDCMPSVDFFNLPAAASKKKVDIPVHAKSVYFQLFSLGLFPAPLHWVLHALHNIPVQEHPIWLATTVGLVPCQGVITNLPFYICVRWRKGKPRFRYLTELDRSAPLPLRIIGVPIHLFAKKQTLLKRLSPKHGFSFLSQLGTEARWRPMTKEEYDRTEREIAQTAQAKKEKP